METCHKLFYTLTFLYFGVCAISFAQNGSPANGMFENFSEESGLSLLSTSQLNYGIAVADVDFDGVNEFVVAGFSGPNLVLKWNTESNKLENIAVSGSPYEKLADPQGQAIGVCACDVDGNGKEEIYFLNTNRAYAGQSAYPDVMFMWRDGKYTDIYADSVNTDVSSKNYAGRSVSCVDRLGIGKYGFLIATYSQNSVGAFSLVEMDESDARNDVTQGNIVLKDVGEEVGIKKPTGGRAVTVGPIVNDEGRSDIYFHNEGNPRLGNRGENFLFENQGDGTFVDVAGKYNVQDIYNNGRGVALTDLNHDGEIDMVLGNWAGTNKILIQYKDGNERTFGEVIVPQSFAERAYVRNVLVADFDNNIDLEIFINNIVAYGVRQPNKLFTVHASGPANAVEVEKIDVGDAEEPDGYGTGAAYADINGDGFLELIVAHGESNSQPLEIFKVRNKQEDYNWLRVKVLTQYGAPARGAKVEIKTDSGDQQMRVIDGGSGYLCQMEPIAHFGLKDEVAVSLKVTWPDTRTVELQLTEADNKRQKEVKHPDYQGTDNNANRRMEITRNDPGANITHTEL